MAGLARLGIVAFCFGMFALTSPIVAKEYEEEDRETVEERDESVYYQPQAYQPNSKAIIHEKAQMRAYQRNMRLASMSWYGMYNGRPTAAPTPFTSLYSPVWQMPGGRPYAWHTRTWPTYVIYVR